MKKTNKTSRRLVALVAVLALAMGAIIGGTLAYLMDETDPIVNTFTYGNIDIDLTETGAAKDAETGQYNNEYKVMPGNTVTKDPVVKVKSGSEACYLYVQLDKSEGFDNFMTYVMADGWRQLDGYENIWYQEVEEAEEDKSFQVLKDNEVIVKPSVTKEMVDGLNGNMPTLTVTAYAVQKEGFNNPASAFISKGAVYVSNQETFKEAIEAGKPVVLNDNVAVTPEGIGTGLVAQMNITKDTTLNLSGKALGVDPKTAEETLSYTPSIMAVTDGATLTIDGDGTINAEAGGNSSYGIDVIGGTVVINSGNFYGAMTAVQVETGALVINGGFFDMAPTCKAAVPQFAKYIINCIDAHYKDGSATIEIKGGTFVNFDPSANPEGAGTSYVADGYKVESEVKDNGETWYTVVPAEIPIS